MNTKNMSFGEALDWMHENECKTVCAVTEPNTRYRIKNAQLQFESCGNDNAFVESSRGFNWQFSMRWMVVEPKSKIEEAIEREITEVPFSMYQKEKELYGRSMRRLVNVALDEAKGAIKSVDVGLSDMVAAIEALKVKE